MASNFHDSGTELGDGVHLMPFFVDHSDGTLSTSFRGRDLECNTLELPQHVQGRVLVPGPVRLPAAAAAVSAAAGAAARRAALKKLKRKKNDWSDDSSDDDVTAGGSSAATANADAPQAARPESTWSTQHRFSKLNYWLHDERSSHNDQPQQCLQWVKDAAQIHRPLSQSEIDAVCALLPASS